MRLVENTNNITVENNENYQPGPQKAEIGWRIGAFIIDHVIIFFVMAWLLLLLIFRMKDLQSIMIDPGRFFVLIWVYMALWFLMYCMKDCIGGASIGKRLMGLTVRSDTGELGTPSVFRLFLRNILSFIWFVELLVLLCSSDQRKIGDRIAGTDVFRTEGKRRIIAAIVIIVLIYLSFIAAMVAGIGSVLKNDSSYQLAINHIESDAEINNIIGDIKGYGFMPYGSLNYQGSQGQASYSIKVIGEKKTIYVDVEMEKMPDTDWAITHYHYDD